MHSPRAFYLSYFQNRAFVVLPLLWASEFFFFFFLFGAEKFFHPYDFRLILEG